jgi:hypothetical protein
MANKKRTTVSFSSKIHCALKAKASASNRGFSELVNEAVELTLREDGIDKKAFRQRAHESSRTFSRARITR